MKYVLPGELWNQVEVPVCQQSATNVSTYLSEMAYKLASITDVMMVKEFWHTVCDFAERCGALRERIVGTISTSSPELGTSTSAFGNFQRFVGAGVDGIPVGLDCLSTKDTSDGPALVFGPKCVPVSGASDADALFREDLAAVGVGFARRWLFYFAVRLFGRRRYNNEPKGQ